MNENILRLLQVLKDLIPELQSVDDKEMYNLWKLWMGNWHKGKLIDFISSNKQKAWESK